jgi:hypothetical protein
MAGVLDEWLIGILADSMIQLEMGKYPIYTHFRWFGYPQ